MASSMFGAIVDLFITGSRTWNNNPISYANVCKCNNIKMVVDLTRSYLCDLDI